MMMRGLSQYWLRTRNHLPASTAIHLILYAAEWRLTKDWTAEKSHPTNNFE